MLCDQKNCGCSLPGSVHVQVGWGSEERGLVEGALSMTLGLALGDT